MIIAIDFDGTCVTHEFPNIGKDIGAIPILKKLVEKGHKLILFTMRCNKKLEFESEIILNESNFLDDAINWFLDNDIELYACQSEPNQGKWTSSNKCYAQLYIDDAGLGMPLIFNKNISKRPFVNWIEVEKLLIERGVL